MAPIKRYGLSAEEKIKSRKDFENIYSSGKILFTTDKKIKVIFIVEKNNANPGVKISAAVNKKHGNAVWRNRVKRLLREAYRLNKETLVALCKEKGVLIKIVFSSNVLNKKNNRCIVLDDIMPGVVEIISKLNNRI